MTPRRRGDSAPAATDASPGSGHFDTLARYHVWATVRLFEHVDALPDDDYRRDAGLFFKSVHGTLNHLLVAEHRVWFPRFAEGISNRVALDAELETDRARLRERLLAGARPLAAADRRLAEPRASTARSTTRRRAASRSRCRSRDARHVFNHGTHHRGRSPRRSPRWATPCPELDLVWMLQAESAQP